MPKLLHFIFEWYLVVRGGHNLDNDLRPPDAPSVGNRQSIGKMSIFGLSWHRMIHRTERRGLGIALPKEVRKTDVLFAAPLTGLHCICKSLMNQLSYANNAKSSESKQVCSLLRPRKAAAFIWPSLPPPAPPPVDS